MEVNKFHNNAVEVVLSKRNLLTLLAKLERPESKKTLCRITKQGFLFVRAEADETHYKNRKPGEMHPKEEAFLKAGM